MNDDYLKLSSLSIRGFRGFRDFSVGHLGRVNLFVGKNNSGKTSIVEAIQLYYSGADRARLAQMLVRRDEFKISPGHRDSALAIESLFYGRPNLERDTPAFSIGPIDSDQWNQLVVHFAWLEQRVEETDGSTRLTTALLEEDFFGDGDIIPGLSVQHRHRELLIPLVRLDARASRMARPREEFTPVVYLSSSGMTPEEIGATWDSVALTEDETTVVDHLRIIIPTIEKLAVIQSPNDSRSRILMAKLSQFEKPVPLKSLGEGVNHLLGIILGLVRARNGVFIVDEIENGIHYSVQHALWEIIFSSAQRWNIQVFATTHSWDCVRGFSLESRYSDSGMLYRVEAEHEHADVRAVEFSPIEIDIAVERNIEVR